jgi:zinc transport system substrate-binding protein
MLAAACAAGCGAEGRAADHRRQVVAGFYPLAFAAERIAGATAEVDNLTPVGAEPHDVELSARDVQHVRSADLVLLLGDGFQPALEDAAEGASGEVVDVLHGVPVARNMDEDGHVDPHVWLDPVLFAAIVKRIGAALHRPEPAHRLTDRLHVLDRAYRSGLAQCAQRSIVTSHAAFGYLARRYGLQQVAITGLSPEAEPTPRDLERVVDQVRTHDATTVFFEPLVSPRLADTVAREVGAETAVLDPLEGLTQSEVDHGDDYFSVMRSNLAALRKGLGCR